jgi:small subunit ribosomal protein S12
MPTIQQMVRGTRTKKRKRSATYRTLKGNPFLKAIVLRTMIVEPVKPNSANRLCCRVRLSNGVELTAHIPGEGHNINEHSRVLIRGGNVPDLPGVKHKVVRGWGDCCAVEMSSKFKTRRNRARSRYGTKKL